MQELDWVVGELLDKLDELRIADNTIVIFATDNGAQKFSWPDGGTSPFRGEKGLGWEGGFRAPFLIRWPTHIPAGQVLNGIFSLEDVVPTVMAAVGVPDVKERLLQGYEAGNKTFTVHLDGYNQLPYLEGTVAESARTEFFYYGEHELFALRHENWKVHFATKDDWFSGPLNVPTVPQPVNLRVDPFEQHMTSPNYPRYAGDKLWTIMPAAAIMAEHARTFEDFPPARRHPSSIRKGWQLASWLWPLSARHRTAPIRQECSGVGTIAQPLAEIRWPVLGSRAAWPPYRPLRTGAFIPVAKTTVCETVDYSTIN